MTTTERAKQQARRIVVRDMVARFPVHLDTSADLEYCIKEILAYGDRRAEEAAIEAKDDIRG